jgi:hypothetical protein
MQWVGQARPPGGCCSQLSHCWRVPWQLAAAWVAAPATSSTWSICSTGMIFKSARARLGTSTRSFMLRLGRMMVFNPGPVSCQDLLAHAAHRKHTAAQRDLTRHAHLAPHFSPGKGRGQRGADGDPGAGPIFGDGAFGNVNVNIHLLKYSDRYPARGRAISYKTRLPGLTPASHCRSAR